ncbi:5738_t:CDS:1 [Acaulospora morrowiae]|uniref:5738_t:CDS:1 n=1 Tax=Acaulospora morrowiae TaxID=94023 RepID=A0A9N9EP51_9GLOM|nr:5738_t:CDS:1 [Acaulospora morrowiae]
MHEGSIENPPTLPLFGMSSSKELRTPPQPTQQPYLSLQPQYYAYIPPYPSFPLLSPQSHSAVSSPLKKVPSMKEFLNELNETYGEGTYTHFETSFMEQEVLVQFISEFTNTDFKKLGIKKIGWQKVLRRATLKILSWVK